MNSAAGPNRKSDLEALVVDSQEGDIEKMLKKALDGRVVFLRGQARVVSRPALFELQLRQRLLALLLARHAMKMLGLTPGVVLVSPQSLASESQIPVQRTREYLSRLKREGLVERTNDGYAIAEWNIFRAAEELGAAT